MYAEVLIEYKVKTLDKTFTYKIPKELETVIKVGMKVTVPFGNGERVINGFVTNIEKFASTQNVKEIVSIVDEELVLNQELRKLGEYISETTLSSKMSAYETMLPPSLKIKEKKGKYQKYDVYLVSKLDNNFLEELMYENISCGQKKIIEDIIKDKKVLKKNYSESSVKTLLKKGVISEEKEAFYRIDKSFEKEVTNIKLNDMQQKCFNAVVESLNTPSVFLLHGVTGSGKTEVYMHLIEEVRKMGKSAIMLVPEITLSTQIVDNFYKRFGEDVAIFHSKLSNGERYDEYLKLYRGDAHIVVGTRSAIFTPVKDLGIIIIDEEQSDSYKQDNTPRYNAIDIAKWRSKYNNIPLVLGSATPTYESFARALKGVYKLLILPNRIHNETLPKIQIVDMKEEMKKRNTVLSESLKIKITDRLEKHEQIMLLLNRRGYGTMVSCSMCGFTYKCPNCDITLTYHKSSNSLRCHYCGYFTKKEEKCPECKEGYLQNFGTGTEKLLEEMEKMFPTAKIVRMDADTTSKKGSHEKIIKDFKEEKYDILLGTQMISKGLDFPKVSLVGVISADASLNIPDFRSNERTFALLSQVAGRAGRSGLESDVVIQTFNPDHFTIKMVEKGTYLKNYQYEMVIRKKLNYPPYCFLIGIKVCSKVYEDASKEATKVYSYLKNNIEKDSEILGPTTAGIFKIKNIYRFQIVIKYRFDKKIKPALKEIDNMYINNKTTYLEIDVDPYYI